MIPPTSAKQGFSSQIYSQLDRGLGEGGHWALWSHPSGGRLFIENTEWWQQDREQTNQCRTLEHLSHSGTVKTTIRLVGWVPLIPSNHGELT